MCSNRRSTGRCAIKPRSAGDLHVRRRKYMFASLQDLLLRRNQRFVCTDTGWPEPGPERHVAMIRHEVTPPLDETSLSALREQIGNIPDLLKFYRRWGSARPFCDSVFKEPIGYASAFFIASPDEWRELKEDFEGWIENLNEDERDEMLPEWIDAYVVVGKIPNSGNYFLVPLKGSEEGKVIEFEHDGFEFIERAASFAGFVDAICTVNEVLLHEILGHTRYHDGKSSVQWLCKQYLYDASDA